MIVETPAIDTAAPEKYLRNNGSVPLDLNWLLTARNSSVHGIRNKTPVATYIPPDCSNCTDNSKLLPTAVTEKGKRHPALLCLPFLTFFSPKLCPPRL